MLHFQSLTLFDSSGVFVTSITVIKRHGDGNLTKHFLGNCSFSQSITIMTGNMAAGKQTWYSNSSWEPHPDSQARGRRIVVESAKPSDKGFRACPAGLRLTRCSISWLCPYFLLDGSEELNYSHWLSHLTFTSQNVSSSRAMPAPKDPRIIFREL